MKKNLFPLDLLHEAEHLEVSKNIHKVKNELDDVSAPLKAEKKKLEKREDLINAIELGKIDDDRTVYVIPDFENQKVGIYDESGNLIRVRVMLPEEKQYKLK